MSGRPPGGRGGYKGGSGQGSGSGHGGHGGGGGGRGNTFNLPVRSSGSAGPGDVPEPDKEITRLEDMHISNPRNRTIEYPPRPGYGTAGRTIVLWTNYFRINISSKNIGLFRYLVSYPETMSKTSKRVMMTEILKDSRFANAQSASDFSSIIITTAKLDLGPTNVWEDRKYLPDVDEPANVEITQATRQRRMKRFKVEANGGPFNASQLLQYLSSTAADPHYDDKEAIVQLLNIVMGMAPNQRSNVHRIGQTNKFYADAFADSPENPTSKDLGEGLRALRGYYASVRTATGRILLNLNVTSGAFYKPIALSHVISECLRQGSSDRGLVMPISADDKIKLDPFVHFLKVETNYMKSKDKNGNFVTIKKNKTIVGFAPAFGNADDTRFDYTDATTKTTNKVTVAQYFQRRWGVTLRYPGQPVINVGRKDDPTYIPMELCTVLPGQAVRKMLSGPQTTDMLGFSARRPDANARLIATEGLDMFGLSTAAQSRTGSHLTPFGFDLGDNPRMLTVPGRILVPPAVQYMNKQARVNNGSWNMIGQKFARPGNLTRWATLVLRIPGSRGNQFGPGFDKSVITTLHDTLSKTYGMTIGSLEDAQKMMRELELPAPVPTNRAQINRILEAKFQGAQENQIQLILIVIKDFDRWLYSRIKYYGDVVFGVQTILSIGQKLQKQQLSYLCNLALKFNVKAGGVSHTVQLAKDSLLDDNTMLMGIDVTHPSPGSKEDSPSIAAVVANYDKFLCQWPGSIRLQEGRKEMVTDLRDMIEERIDVWADKHQRRLPTRIILYRDGVSEGQFQQVLDLELPCFQEAFKRKYGKESNWPKMAIIIVGKRHHTRFYPTKEADADGKNGNPLPGTIVDRGVTDSYLYDFFLQAHSGLQGTARPAHYTVIYDQIRLKANQFEQFTFDLCHNFNRATKAVSICPPAYYADLLCERGRMYLFSRLNENVGSVSGGTDENWDGTLHPKIKNTTFYI